LNQKGFTLIELLIGLIILAIGLLGIAGMQITSVKGNIFSSSVTQAVNLAQDKLEYLKNLSYTDSQLNPGQYSAEIISGISGLVFSRYYNIVEDAGDSIKTITVTVQWTDRVTHSITLTTIRTS
jgi:type IV pilus assembly protein PilV